MERWETIVGHQIEPGHRAFEKLLQTASTTLKNDLAPFETEWVIDTLLYKPVDLLCTVSERRGDEVWQKGLGDAVKLLAEIVAEWSYAEKYYEDIVNLCLLSYDAELRKHALNCLICVTKKSEIGAKNYSRHITSLEEGSQCKTPLALLVGAICEHHPSVICNDINKIWRTYLNMLENNKNTDTFTKAVLEGICGLFKHFGEDLPTAELNNFYESLSCVYMKKNGCRSACLKILEDYAGLFRERISLDRYLRDQLWECLGEDSGRAILNVYRVMSRHVDKKVLEKIISIEVLPHTQASHTKMKLTALRILAFAKITGLDDLTQYVDMQTLENEFRRDKVTHGHADMIQWCIESNLPNSERLLQAAILFYDKLPPTKRKAIVVNGILDSPRYVRQAAIHFLITQSCENDSMQIWRDLYDVSNDDVIVKAQAVTREFANYLTTAVALFLEERRDSEDIPPKLASLLRLTSKVAPLTSPLTSCASLLCELAESCSTAELTSALRAVLLNAPVQESANFYKSLRIESCRDEAMLHECCLTLIQAPDSVNIEPANMLFAFQIIFSSDVEPSILCSGIKKLDILLTNSKITHQDAMDVIYLVKKLRSSGDKTDKHIRILHREVLMFLGKHGSIDVNNNTSTTLDLKKTLTLNLPHQGATFRVNLHRILVLALHHEDPKVLQVLMTMLYANLSSNKEQASQTALTRVVQTLAKIHASGAAPLAAAVQRAASMLDARCVAQILQYISTTKSCGVRKLLATALAPLCEDADIVQLTVERGTVMMASLESTTKRAGLDVAETIISSLENNNALCKTILPQILTLTAKTYENDAKMVFDSATKMFVDKKGLFENAVLKEIVYDLLKNLIKTKMPDVKIYKTTVKMTVEFLRKIDDVKIDDLLEVVFGICQNDVDVKVVFVLTLLKSVFGFDADVSRMVLGRDNAVVMEFVFNSVFDDTELGLFNLETILLFLEEYCQVMLELRYKETIKLLSDIIIKLTPRTAKNLRKNLKSCFSTFKKHCIVATPRLIQKSFQIWTEKLPLQNITESLERQHFLPQHVLSVNALKIMSKIFDTKELILSDVKFEITKWPKRLLKLYSSGMLEECHFNETPYFNDILTVSLKFLPISDVKKLVLEGRGINLAIKDVGVLFCGFFIQGFSEVLTEEPYFLLDHDMESCSVILNDLVKYYVKKTYVKDECEKLLELVNKLWPAYEKHTTFAQKHSLLVNLECLKGLGQDSMLLQWVLDSISSQELPIEEKIKLVSFVPEEILSSPRGESVLALFPARLCELRPALLEALADRPCALHVRTIAALVANDTSSGWWDEALDSCLAAIGQNNREDICRALYDSNRGARACSRVLVPLLRYSSAESCEKFLASTLDRILATLRKRPTVVKANRHYQKSIEDYIISLSLLLVAFEKLPTSSLEASSSPLYSGIQKPMPWHIVRETLIFCDSLRRCDAVACPADALPSLKSTYRQFQCVLYNCYCAAICRRRPSEKVYRLVFGAAWLKIIDEEKTYSLPITPSWIKRNRSLPVSVPVESSSLLTSHSHIFLRTLSEHPMLFDLHTQQDDVPEVQDILLPETDLNGHPCAATLTALFRHVAALPFALWTELASSLENGHTNLKWLLAQIICNCKQELKAHASVLLPGLLAAVATTVAEGACLNGLHLDVLDTVIFWKEDATSVYFNRIIHHLINTCMEHRRSNTFDGLLKTLYGLLELYGSSIQIGWESFEPYYTDQSQDTYLKLFQLVKTICKVNIYVPESLEKILSKLDTNPSKIAECFGLAMAACHNDSDRNNALSTFKKALHKMNVTNFVKVLYYGCMGSAACCGETEFRKIVSYVMKVTSSDRSKCLHTMSVYVANNRPSACVAGMFETIELSEMLVVDPTAMLLVKNGMNLMSDDLKRQAVLQIADSCQNSSVKIRKAAIEVMLTAFEDLFSHPTSQPSAKRQKTETTPIFNIHKDDLYGMTVLTCLGIGATDSGGDIASVVREKVGGKLSTDLGVRFAECFFIIVYLPSLRNIALDMSVCVSAILEMLYSGMRKADNFKNIKLREEPIALSVAPVPAKLLTLSKAFQGTFSSYSTSKARQTNKEDCSKSSIDVQIPIDDVLETLLEFATTGPGAARSLLTEVLHSVLAGSAFDLASRLLPLLGTVLARPTDLTPLCIDVARVLIGHGGSVQELLVPAKELRDLTIGTEDAALTTLLHEDVHIRYYGNDIFKLGIRRDTQDVTMDETTTFSLEDLKATFGRLSNWDNLTLQQRRSIRDSSLPPLWTDRRDIVARLDAYEVPTGIKSWFDKMVVSYKQEMAHNSFGWLRAMDQWPRRHFEISAITEATSWRHDPSELTDAHSNIFTTNECLAEWAARLLVRSSYYNSLQHSQSEEDRIDKLSRSHELKWCMRANEMGLSRAALDCVKRNVEDICESETLPWLRQKLLAMRSVGLEQNDTNILESLLEKARRYNTLEYARNPSVSIELYHLMLLLHKDLGSLSYQNLQLILQQVNETSKSVDWNQSSKAAVSSIFEAAMIHYDHSWDEGTLSHERVLSDMTEIFCQAVDLNTSIVDMLLAVILNRLDEYAGKMEAGCCEKLLQKLSPLTPALDQFTRNLINKNATKFPNRLMKTYPLVTPKDDDTEKYKQCLQIVCDSQHMLASYCGELMIALKNKDADQWKLILDRIKNKIYENPYTGPSYRLLDKYKDELYSIYEFETTNDFLETSKTTLQSIILSLNKEPVLSLRLSDLCPALMQYRESGADRLFRLTGVTIVKFYDKVQVFADSIRRPVVISMLLSNGKIRRTIHKSGESLAGDAAAMRASECAARVCGATRKAYSVTLLDEDSALIEFLEGHERLRTLVESACNINALSTVMRPADRDLIESPIAASLQRHNDLCSKVPAYALRSAIEQSSSSVQDFISKKQNFTDSLSFMTIVIWILGLGDRHLQNIMLSQDGVVCCVDWGDAWRHGAAEMPARLTRNLLAVCDVQVLESRLQTTLVALRGSSQLLEAAIKVSFKWMGDRFHQKFKYVQNILRGTEQSYDVYREVMGQDENLKHREKHLELLDHVFRDVEKKDVYNVEEQISCLLLHCTSPELLSVTRSGWEPWI